MNEMGPFIFAGAFLAVMGLSLFISARMTKRAASQVIRIFREKNAIGIRQAKTIAELGLTPPTFVQRLARLRDYKQSALHLLIKSEIVGITEEGKMFIFQEKLDELSSKGM